MKMIFTMVVGMALAFATGAENRKTIYVDRMEGLEPFVEKALQSAELPFDFIEERNRPELKATLAKSHSVYGELLYKHKLGRTGTHRLELLDVEKNKVIAWHAFELSGGEESRKRAAEAFAASVKKAWATRNR